VPTRQAEARATSSGNFQASAFRSLLKVSATCADIISVNICKELCMKFTWLTIALLTLLGAAALAQDAPKKISRGDALSALVTKVQPDYPTMAKQLKIQGTVELEATVAETGEVTKVDIVSGNPMLTAPAANAVKHWKFKPFLEDGKPVRVVAPVTMDFKL
jgi:TonB family protein